jgi:putative aldouronate transport system permease protein
MIGTRTDMQARPYASTWPKALRSVRMNGDLLLIFLPVAVYYVVFCYIPMSGVVMAFKDYKISSTIWASKWVGMKHFNALFSTPSFFEVLRNTVVISLLKLLFGFPAPILLAILLNELNSQRFKRVIQTISYMPHFLSWVVLAGIFIQFLSPSTGPINILLNMLGRSTVFFLGSKNTFVPTIVATHVWQTVGWSSIIYLASITSINIELYESAMLDGATRFQRIAYVTLPGIMPTITVLFILSTGSILNAGFDQIFNLYNEAVYSVADIIDTYVYRRGLTGMQYSYASAVGLFKNVIGFMLVFATNMIARRMGDSSLW